MDSSDIKFILHALVEQNHIEDSSGCIFPITKYLLSINKSKNASPNT